MNKGRKQSQSNTISINLFFGTGKRKITKGKEKSNVSPPQLAMLTTTIPIYKGSNAGSDKEQQTVTNLTYEAEHENQYKKTDNDGD